MNNIETAYNEYIKSFVGLDTYEKQTIIIEKLKEIIAVLSSNLASKGFDYQPLLNREMADLNKENVSDDDYLEAIFAYLISLEDLIAKNVF